MALAPYATTGERVWYYGFRFICGLIFLFLIMPILIVLPLSFNEQPYFSFTEGMLAFEAEAYSTRWYADIYRNGMAAPDDPATWGGFFSWLWQSIWTSAVRTVQWIIPFWDEDTTLLPTASYFTDIWDNAQWIRSIKNSFFIGILSTLLAVALGTLAAVGLSRSEMPFKGVIMATLISPMIVPLVVIASGLFAGFSAVDLEKSYLGVIIAHAVLGTPFVIITVTATLVGFDKSLVRAAQSMGADPVRTFFKVQMPLILPGVISGALFAFITSFDEVVVVLQLADVEQRTIPRQMFSGIREQISPTILAVATILVAISIGLLATVEMLRRRSERLRGMSPA